LDDGIGDIHQTKNNRGEQTPEKNAIAFFRTIQLAEGIEEND
jgi:hypothetical protein